MGPIDYSILTLASLLKKKYNIDDTLEEEIRSLSSMSADAILPTNIYKSPLDEENKINREKIIKNNNERLKRIKRLGDKWSKEVKQ